MKFDRLHQQLSADEEYRKAYAEEDLIHRIGERIAKLRDASDLSQAELADRLGTKQPAIARLEGGFSNPTTRTLARIAWALRCRPEDLVTRETPASLEPEWERGLDVAEEPRKVVTVYHVYGGSVSEDDAIGQRPYLGAA